MEIFPQEDFELLEELRQIPLERLTGRQREDLHGVFYKKHATQNMKYMIGWEIRIHTHFESLRGEETRAELNREVTRRSFTPGPAENSFSGGFTPISQPLQRDSEGRRMPEAV